MAPRPGQRVELRGRRAVLAALQAQSSQKSAALLAQLQRRWPRTGEPEMRGTVLAVGRAGVEVRLDASPAEVLGLAKLTLPPDALADEAAGTGGAGGAVDWGERLRQHRRAVIGTESDVFVTEPRPALKSQRAARQAPKAQAKPVHDGRATAAAASAAESVASSSSSSSSSSVVAAASASSASSAASAASAAAAEAAAEAAASRDLTQQQGATVQQKVASPDGAGESDSAPGTPLAAIAPRRTRHRRRRMTRAGRAERLQRDIAARAGIESAVCVRSRTVSVASLRRRARARLSTAVALLRSPEQYGWGLPLSVVARILDYMPVAGHPDALREAAAAGDLVRVREHLSLGVDPNAANPGVSGVLGATALHWAASGGHAAVVVTLLNAKADPRLPCAGMAGATALHLAAQSSEARPRNRSESVGAGRNGTDHRDCSGALPVHHHNESQWQWRRRQVMEALLIAGADPSLTTAGVGSLRRARRRLCVCYVLVKWSHAMTNLHFGRAGMLLDRTPLENCNSWFAPLIEKVVNELPLREHTPAEKALEYHESISVLAQWEQAVATAKKLSSSKANERGKPHRPLTQQSQIFGLGIASNVEVEVEVNAYATSIYSAFSDATLEENRRQVVNGVHERLQEIYERERRTKEARRERFRRAVRLHLPASTTTTGVQSATESRTSTRERSRSWLYAHSELLVCRDTYPGLAEVDAWAAKNGLNDNDRRNLLESCRYVYSDNVRCRMACPVRVSTSHQ